jgi:ribulose 1,5-bisphosphate synthetase/thiazole synthase
MRILLGLGIVLVLTSSWALELSEPTIDDRVAVIGAGVGGATAAYYLRQELGNRIRIDV